MRRIKMKYLQRSLRINGSINLHMYSTNKSGYAKCVTTFYNITKNNTEKELTRKRKCCIIQYMEVDGREVVL